MNVKRTSKSGLFLLELMIIILFFSVTSAVCANLFVQAHQISKKGSDLTNATREVQSVAERFKAVEGDMHDLSALYESGLVESDRLDLFYDAQWTPLGTEKTDSSEYTITVLRSTNTEQQVFLNALAVSVPAAKDQIAQAVVIAWDQKGEIFSVTVQKY